MFFKTHTVVAILLTLIAVLYQIECNSKRWQALATANILSHPEKLARFITNTDTVRKWFHWVSHFKEADSRPIGKGKKYQASFDVPLLGEYVMVFHLVDYQPNRLYVLESGGFLKPRIVVHLEPNNQSTNFTLSLEFQRTSALYHFTLGPLLYFLSSEQLRHSLLLLKMMFPF